MRMPRSVLVLSGAPIGIDALGQRRIMRTVPGLVPAIAGGYVGVCVTGATVGIESAQVGKKQDSPAVHRHAVLVTHDGRRIMTVLVGITIDRQTYRIQTIHAFQVAVHPGRRSGWSCHSDEHPRRNEQPDDDRRERSTDGENSKATRDHSQGVADTGIAKENRPQPYDRNGPRGSQPNGDATKTCISLHRTPLPPGLPRLLSIDTHQCFAAPTLSSAGQPVASMSWPGLSCGRRSPRRGRRVAGASRRARLWPG